VTQAVAVTEAVPVTMAVAVEPVMPVRTAAVLKAFPEAASKGKRPEPPANAEREKPKKRARKRREPEASATMEKERPTSAASVKSTTEETVPASDPDADTKAMQAYLRASSVSSAEQYVLQALQSQALQAQALQMQMSFAAPAAAVHTRKCPEKTMQSRVADTQKTFQFCKAVTSGSGICSFGDRCSFAHSEAERTSWTSERDNRVQALRLIQGFQ